MKKFFCWVVLVVCFISMQSCRASSQSSTPTSQPMVPQPTLYPTIVTILPTAITQTVADTLAPSQTVELSKDNAFQMIPFDASQWKYYPLRDYTPSPDYKNPVRSVVWDTNNQAWIGTGGGFFAFDLTKNTWVSHSDIPASSIAVDKNGKVWLGTNTLINGNPFKGLALFDGKSWEYFPLPGAPIDIEIAEDGSVWAAYLATTENDEGVVMYDGHTWKNVWIGEGIPRDHVREHQDDVWSLAITPDQSIWFGTYFDGLFRLDGSQWTHYPLATFPGARPYFGEHTQIVRDIEVAPDSTLWGTLGTDGGAIIHYDGQFWETYPYPWASGLLAVAVSKDGRVWVGEDFGHVLAYWENGQWYSFQGLPFHSVYDISIGPDQSVWVATYYGLYVYYPSK